MSFWGRGDPEAVARLQRKLGNVMPPPDQISPLRFIRLLAKISHSIAVAIYGLGSFRPLLLDLILGRTQSFSDLVGGEMVTPPPMPGNPTYFLTLSQGQVGGAGPWYLVVHLRLFPAFGAPLYHIVVGEMDAPVPDRPPATS
jgi:hypothetical protein